MPASAESERWELGSAETALSEPLHRRLMHHWMAKRGDRAMPDRSDIDPTELPPDILPNLMLIDARAGLQDARFRLVGTAIARRHPKDPTGRLCREVLGGDALAMLQRTLDDVLTGRSPVYNESVSGAPGNEYVRAKRLHLPLSWGGIDAALSLALVVFRPVTADDTSPREIYRRIG